MPNFVPTCRAVVFAALVLAPVAAQAQNKFTPPGPAGAPAPAAAAPAAPAEEIKPSHLAAALEAIQASRVARSMDLFLPQIAQGVQARLIQTRPDLHKEITDVVEGQALKLVSRRPDLDNDVARIWAKNFTEDELRTITTFYRTPAGTKFVDNLPRVMQESSQAVKSWQDRVGDELIQKSREELKRRNINF